MANTTELVFIIDRSGSMSGLESDTIGGVNGVLAKNRGVEGTANVTTMLFDDKLEYLHDHKDLKEVENLTDKDYWVRGCTALLDAVAETIIHVEKVQGYLPKEAKADNVVVTIITDGLENASKRHSYAEVKRMIEAHTEMGWEFLFLGANIDVAAEAGKLGICADNAAPYLSDCEGTAVAYESIAEANVQARTFGKVMKNWAAGVRADVAKRGH